MEKRFFVKISLVAWTRSLHFRLLIRPKLNQNWSESKLGDSVLSSEMLVVIIHLSNYNYIISCIMFFTLVSWRMVSQLMAHFFSVSVLIITGCTCIIDVHGTNTELLVSNTNLEITKRHFPVILNHHFIVFDHHVR